MVLTMRVLFRREDIAELAQSTGTIVYMISTRVAETEPISSAVFERMSKATGGKAYFAKDWRDEKQAFASIRDDLAHLYTVSYYPQSNDNNGWRRITVKLVGKERRTIAYVRGRGTVCCAAQRRWTEPRD